MDVLLIGRNQTSRYLRCALHRSYFHMAIDYGARGVRINAVCPGPTLSPRVRGYVESNLLSGEAIRKMVPLRRFAECREVANAVVFLASDAASFFNGASVVVDGGQTIQ